MYFDNDNDDDYVNNDKDDYGNDDDNDDDNKLLYKFKHSFVLWCNINRMFKFDCRFNCIRKISQLSEGTVRGHRVRKTVFSSSSKMHKRSLLHSHKR